MVQFEYNRQQFAKWMSYDGQQVTIYFDGKYGVYKATPTVRCNPLDHSVTFEGCLFVSCGLWETIIYKVKGWWRALNGKQ